MRRFLILMACIPAAAMSGLRAQTLSGKVFGNDGGTKRIIQDATLQSVSRPGLGTVTNENGVFSFIPDSLDSRIIVSAAGYLTDTINTTGKTYLSITLQADGKALSGIVVRDARGSYLSNLSAAQTEVITQRELTKAACCDLAGCFGTQASVQPQTTNVVTNAQELRILGLSGVYNQVLFDGMPMIGGASYTYGISTYPGTVVDNIYVSKGMTSVLQGFESISGQINLESRQPDKTDRLHLNAYINNFGEKHLNASVATPVGKSKTWSSMLALHAVRPAGRVDNNGDGFLDLPLLTRYMAFNKWRYRNERQNGLSMQIGLRIVNEQRIGGQKDFDADKDEGTTRRYGQTVRYTQPEAYLKSTYRFSPNQAVSVAVSGYYHDQRSWFGTTRYEARQTNAYANIQHEVGWADKHTLKWGISYRYQELNETIGFNGNTLGRTFNGTYNTALRIPGVFAENAFHWKNDKILLITGVRLDRHQTEGSYFTPRTMLKWAINAEHTFRASAGTGWRQVNLFPEQINLLASSRDVVFEEPLKPEQAFNWGLSHTWRKSLGVMDATFSGDFYSTHFQNQFFPDYDSDPTKAYIRNFEGSSRSVGLQLEASTMFWKQLEARAAYNYLDVYRVENGVKTALPFNPRSRAMAAVSYRTKANRWQADANVHWFDRMRLPNTESNPEAYRRPLHSRPYATLNVQGTFRWKTLDLYAGCENLFGFVQPNPIISAENPFGPYFDISSVWGPTRGRELYAGVRWSLR